MRRPLIAAVAAGCALGTVAVVGPPSSAAAACRGTIRITSLRFSPPAVRAGESSTVTLVARNCTDQPQQASLGFVARFVGPAAGIPAGCPAIDPLPPGGLPVGPGGSATVGQRYLVFAGCTATGLQVTARISAPDGTLLATRSTELRIVA